MFCINTTKYKKETNREKYHMYISLNNSFMSYAKSLEGISLKRYSSLSSKVLRSKTGSGNIVTNPSAKSDKE
ncbi:MAG TPA: hypothetical protein DDY31_00265 [Lachnospiraceae bacterium]|nr:hypothetical protein [Lachnospiraceae bacterium]